MGLMECILVIVGVVSAVLAPAFAIVACIALLVAAGYIIRVMCRKKKEINSNTTSDSEKKKGRNDDEEDAENRISQRATTESVDQNKIPPMEAFAVVDLVRVSPMSPKSDTIEAKTY